MKAPQSVTVVPCEPALFPRVARVNCDATGMADTLAGCGALWLDFGDGGAHLAHRLAGPGVVEIVAVEGARSAGSVLDYLPWFEAAVAPCAVQLVTQRRGLVRELGRRGYHVAGVIVRKEGAHGRPFQ